MIISSKLLIPQIQSAIVYRKSLIEKLNDGCHMRLILITAPASYGKTTLVSTWVRQRNEQAQWLSLDKEDNDYVRF